MRGQYEGVTNIVRFNWPHFAIALPLVLLAAAGGVLAPAGVWQVLLALVAGGAATGITVSLLVAHLIYDRSDLYRFAWLSRALHGLDTRRGVFCHTGFDESSTALRRHTPAMTWTLLDHYEIVRMPERSIQRARRYRPAPADTLAVPFNAWQTPSASADIVLGLLAIHELRTDAEREQWFAEAHRTVRPGGRVILVEHLRDLANALAFGPGCLHFHTAAAWARNWERAQFRAREQFRVTPWIRVSVLEPA